MNAVEIVTVSISALAIVGRIAMFIRNPAPATPSELWTAEYPHLHNL
jgi:hypothetical protein